MTCVLCAIAKLSFGQSYFIFPNDSFKTKGMMEDMATLTISQINNTQNNIILGWEKISENVPANWDASICDNKICYTTLVNEGTMNPIAPGDTGFILLHITPHVNFGTSVIRYAVWDTKGSLQKDTLTYILTVENALAMDAHCTKSDASIYPVPATNNLNIVTPATKGFSYHIIDMGGKEVLSGFSENNSATLLTSHLSNGIYSVFITDKKNLFMVKKITVLH